LSPAQTKISGTAQCGKPDTQQKVDVPDHPDHSLSISQAKCTWSKPMEVAGIQDQDKDGVTTATDDNPGSNSRGHGYYVDNMANGDKVHVHFQGTASMKEGAAEGKWTYADGTGKFKGIKVAPTRASWLPMAAQPMRSRASTYFPSDGGARTIA
jgi:hypothetical protein